MRESSESERVSSPDWRGRLLEGLLRTTGVLMTIALPVLIIQTRAYEKLGWTALGLFAYSLVVVACFVARLGYRARALILLFGLAAVSWLGFLRVGYQAGPGIGSAIVVVVAGLLLGQRALLSAYLASLAALLGLGLFHSQDHGSLIASTANDATLFSNWVRVALSFGLFTGVLASAVMFVVSRIESTLQARTQALDELHAEQDRREAAQLALERAQQQILQMQKLDSLGRLAGGIAHDFNNALVVVLGWTDLLRGRAVGRAELNKALDQIATAASSAARLTQQLLSFGRKAVHVPQAVAMPSLVARVTDALSRLVPENVKICREFSEDLPPAWVDPEQIQQVLVNLCLNARDAMPHGGTITIGVQHVQGAEHAELPAGPWIALTVRDTGIGMDAHTLKNAFEPFFTTKGELGNGLGLSSVYGIVQQSQGHVSVASELGQGTIFRVLLPLSAQTVCESAVQPDAHLLVQASATILVAEDEPSVRMLIVEALKSAGHQVLDAEDGERALELARRHRSPIDLLCTDGVMPGIPSRELIAGFHRLFPAAPVLVCSGHIEEQTLRSEVERQELSFLPKPFTAVQLTHAVAAALTGTR